MAEASSDPAPVASVTNHVKLTFNSRLWACDAGIPDRVPNQIIRVHSFSKPPGGTNAILEKAYGSTQQPTPEPKPEELVSEPDAESGETGIWIGVRPKGAGEAKYKSAPPDVKRGAGSVAKLETIHQVPVGRKDTLRVVCKRNMQQATYYALTSQNAVTGLCEAIQVPKEETFYFQEFRDDQETVYERRNTRWAAKVQSVAQNPARSSKRGPSLNFECTTAAPERSIPAEIASFGIGYNVTGDRAYLEEMKRMLEDLDPDLKDKNLISNINLCNLLDSTEPPCEKNCAAALKEIESMWPDVAQKIKTAENLQYIMKGLQLTGCTLRYQYSRMFLGLTCKTVCSEVRDGDDGMIPDESCRLLAQEAIDDIKLLMGDNLSPGQVVSASATKGLCLQVVQMFEHGKKLVANKIDALKTVGGKVVTPGEMADTWKRFGNAPDTESARVYMAQVQSFIVGAAVRAFDPLPQQFHEASAWMRTLMDRMPEEEKEDDESGEE